MTEPTSDALLPPGLVPCGSTRTFTRETLPAGLLRDHSLRAGRWGLLQLLEGTVTFVDQERELEIELSAPATHLIAPQALHHLKVAGPFACRIEFFEAG